MSPRPAKAGIFAVEALNAFATSYFGTYIYFFTQHSHGFGKVSNLALSAAGGFIYIGGSWLGGRFAQKHGYFTALRLGFIILAAGLAWGGLFPSALAHVLTMLIWTAGLCLTWPTLEALVSEGEDWPGLQRMIGIYNVTWAVGSALAFFIGGALMEKLGWASLFWLPVGVHALQFVALYFIEAPAPPVTAPADPSSPRLVPHENAGLVAPGQAKVFLRMAWLANPFAYIAINSVIPVLPDLAVRLQLSPAVAGYVCSIFYITRLAAFVWLWQWAGWHYRFSWLAAAYAVLLLSYAILLLVPQLILIIVAQVFFGLAIGLIYYSSLFYSMDVGETKGEHGGLHEAAIGGGLFAGPAVGAATLHFLPQYPHSGTWAVCSLLVAGGLGLWWLNRQRKPA
jgi:MFS family permease